MPEVQEAIHTARYNRVLGKVKTVNVHNEKDCDEVLEEIDVEYRIIQSITEEQVRYLTRILCSRS